MKTKIKIILSALIIQGCFFSSSLFADTKYYYELNGSIVPNTYIYNDAESAKAAACASVGATYYPTYYCKDSDLNNVAITGSGGRTCTDYVQPDGTCDTTDPLAAVCVDRLDTIVTTIPIETQSDGMWKDYDGCVYEQAAGTPVVCDSSTLCTVTATGTGSYNSGIPSKGTQIEATPTNPYGASEITESTSSFSTDTVSVDNGDGTTTDTTTDVNNKNDNQKVTITYDGETVTTINNDGTQTNTTTVTTTTTLADGSQTETVQTTSTTTQAPVTTTNTNINTGQTTSSTVPGSTTTTTTGSNSTYDSAGDLTSRDYTTTESSTDELIDPNCPSCVPNDDAYVNGDFTSIDSSIDALKNPFNTDAMSKPSLSINLGSLGTCNNANYSANVLGSTFAPDVCTWISIIQSVLYWFFAVSTAIYIFHVATTLGKQS